MRLSSATQLILDLNTRISSYNPKINEQYIEEAALMEDSFHEFVKQSWHINEGDRPFNDNWHIQAECEHLEALYYGDILRILINVPPGTCKSSICSVAFPAWVWAKDPSRQFLYASYGSSISMRDSVNCRRIIASKWFMDRWGHKCQLTKDVNTKSRFDNKQSGYRIATSLKGAATGEHVDFAFFDDPNNMIDVESDVKRETANVTVDRAFSGRFNDPKTGRCGIIQQRTHAKDVSGHVLGKGIEGLVHLCLPMEFETSRRCITVPLKSTLGKPWCDPRTEEGELLWPTFMDEISVKKGKIDLGSEYAIAGQYQQRPAPAMGGILRKDWWQHWKQKEPPRCDYVLQSWDTAYSVSSKSSHSACVTLGVFSSPEGIKHIMVLSGWRGRVAYPDLRKMALRLQRNYYDTDPDHPFPEDWVMNPHMLLIESKSSGGPLIQDLTRAGLIVHKFDPGKEGGGDKEKRAQIASNLIEAGRVWVPCKPPNFTSLRAWADVLVEDCALFPNGESNDYVDALSQGLIKLRALGHIGHPDDAVISSEFNRWQGEKFY